jgi:hypothetical protein
VDGNELMPQSLTGRQMSSSILENVEAFGVVNLPSGSVLTLTTTTENRIKPDELIVGVQPFQIAFYQDFYNPLYRIPISSNVLYDDYHITGPLHEPKVLVKNTAGTVLIDIGDKAKVITKTYMKNNSGVAHNIIYFTGARAFSPVYGTTGTPSNT